MAFVWFSPKMQFMLEKQDKCLIFFFPFIYQTSQWRKKKKKQNFTVTGWVPSILQGDALSGGIEYHYELMGLNIYVYIHCCCYPYWCLFYSFFGQLEASTCWCLIPFDTTLVAFVGFPNHSVGKDYACHAGDLGLIPGLGRSPGEEKGYSLQYSDLENFMN